MHTIVRHDFHHHSIAIQLGKYWCWKLHRLLYCGLFLRLVRYSWVLSWSLNGSISLNKQTVSCKLPLTWLVRLAMISGTNWSYWTIFSFDGRFTCQIFTIVHGSWLFSNLGTYHIWQYVCRGKFCGFHSFSLNCKSFPLNHGLVNQQYKSTKMLQQKIYHE